MPKFELNIGGFISLENSWSLAAVPGCIIHTQIGIALASGAAF